MTWWSGWRVPGERCCFSGALALPGGPGWWPGPSPCPTRTRWTGWVPPDFDPDALAFLAPGLPGLTGKGGGTLRFLPGTPSKVRIEVTATGGGLLLLADTYAPGWLAHLDGAPVPLVRADYCFQAVALPPGNHVVEFSYDPYPFRIGLLLAGTGAFMLFGLILLRRRLPLRPKPGGEP